MACEGDGSPRRRSAEAFAFYGARPISDLYAHATGTHVAANTDSTALNLPRNDASASNFVPGHRLVVHLARARDAVNIEPMPFRPSDVLQATLQQQQQQQQQHSSDERVLASNQRLRVSEPFCSCSGGANNFVYCRCGEGNQYLEWGWDRQNMSVSCELSEEDSTVLCHPGYSRGSACLRGALPLEQGRHHYWEIKILTPCFGTDIMIGVGTERTNVHEFEHNFVSMLGYREDSWGMSYKGGIQHNKQWFAYDATFGLGAVVGVHLDLFRGTLSYYLNRRPLGVAVTGLLGKRLYPMLSCTAAKSRFRLITAQSFGQRLEFLCLQAVQQSIPKPCSINRCVELAPGLLEGLRNNYFWLMGNDYKTHDDPAEYGGEPLHSCNCRKPNLYLVPSSLPLTVVDESDEMSS